VPFELTVAVVASTLPRLAPPVGDNGFEKRYSERTMVPLTAEDDETLESVYRRAIDELKPRVVSTAEFPLEHFSGDLMDIVHWAWFYEEADEEGLLDQGKAWEVAEELVTVDENGRAQWGRSAREIPYGDLIRAGEHALVCGDPRRPYLVFLLPQYDGGVLQLAWDAFTITWRLLGELLVARALYNIAKGIRRDRLRERLEGAEVIVRHQDEWVTRRGGPRRVERTLERRPWPVSDLRALLGLETDEEAAALLSLFGFHPNDQGEYDIGEDAESRLLRQIAEAASRGDLSADDEQTRPRLNAALETGELPPRRWI
jgi:hypothetical protein